MIQETFEVSEHIKPRTIKDVLVHLMEEVGELSTEIAIDSGTSSKEVGKDGIVGEAVDVILCALDIMWVHNQMISEEEIMAIVKLKLEKWYQSRKK